MWIGITALFAFLIVFLMQIATYNKGYKRGYKEGYREAQILERKEPEVGQYERVI